MRITFLLLSTFLTLASSAQTGSAKYVTLTTTAVKTGVDVYEVKITADIKGDYHIYAQVAGVEGPVPSHFTFTPNPLVTLIGGVKESGSLIKKYEAAWEGNVNYYEKKVVFTQQVKLKARVKTSLAGKVEFMVCNENQCLPPAQVDFKVAIGG